MTPEERAEAVLTTAIAAVGVALRAYGDERAAAARKACAQLAKNWEPHEGDGLDYPPGDIAAGIAAAILASKEP